MNLRPFMHRKYRYNVVYTNDQMSNSVQYDCKQRNLQCI